MIERTSNHGFVRVCGRCFRDFGKCEHSAIADDSRVYRPATAEDGKVNRSLGPRVQRKPKPATRGIWTERLDALSEKKLALGFKRINSIRKAPSRARPYTTLPVDHMVR